MIHLEFPFIEENIRKLKVGDFVELSGVIFTGRDAVHKWLFEGNTPPLDLQNGIIYHCGPIVHKQKKGGWRVLAAGPTTSIREEPYQATLIERFNLRAVIGKGGMGPATKEACERCGCVYLHAVGGAAQVLAERVVDVVGVFGIEEFGSPEAIWQFKVDKFPAIVTIDAHGKSLHEQVETYSRAEFSRILTSARTEK